MTVLKWYGGKHYLAKKIIELMPARVANSNNPASDDSGWLHYVEPYFGSGAVLFAQSPEGISEVVNDLNSKLMNFYRVLQDRELFIEFSRVINLTPMSEELFNSTELIARDMTGRPEVDRAVDLFIRVRQSRQALGKEFVTLVRNRTRRGMAEHVSAWLSAVDGLQEVHERLSQVILLSRPAVEVIKTQDGPRTLFYLDPPYVQSTRVTKQSYDVFEMGEQEHAELLDTLSRISGRFILSGYRNHLYDDTAERFGWRRVDVAIDNKASSAKEKSARVESLWLNY